VAIKCDLCYFRPEGPACVIACPHKALALVTEQATPAQNRPFERLKEVAAVTKNGRPGE
jgi:hydrogenase-4 component A